MNPEHLEVVKQGAKAIEAWRQQHPDRVFDLIGARLGEADLSGAMLAFRHQRTNHLAYLCWALNPTQGAQRLSASTNEPHDDVAIAFLALDVLNAFRHQRTNHPSPFRVSKRR